MTTALLTPAVDDATRRRFLTGLVAAGLLTACASTADPDPRTPAATATWTRGPFGPIDVPRDPQRVVACNAIDADFALVLGLTLVGAPGAIGQPDTPFADYHADRLAGVSQSLTGGEPNVEQVASLRPDLILDSWSAERERYDNWSALAPTINFVPVLYPGDFADTDWPAAVRALGQALGREQAAEDAVATYRTAIDAVRAASTLAPGTVFAAVNAAGQDGLSVTDAGQQICKVAQDLGLTPHPLVAADYTGRVSLSLEEIGRLADADVLLVNVPVASGSLDRDRAELGPLTSSPLWQRLPAVLAGRVVEFPSELYYASPLTAPALVDFLAAGLS